VARAEADGHTLMFGTSGPLAINVSLYRKIGYDPTKSFAPVIQVGHLPNIACSAAHLGDCEVGYPSHLGGVLLPVDVRPA
jgi:tripartite-type tricarboxylate transporter receptor subunit TctC